MSRRQLKTVTQERYQSPPNGPDLGTLDPGFKYNIYRCKSSTRSYNILCKNVILWDFLRVFYDLRFRVLDLVCKLLGIRKCVNMIVKLEADRA